MDTYSDSESVYSVDSLEGEIQGDTNHTNCLATSRHRNVTIPFYKGEISVEDIKSIVDIKPRNTHSYVSPKSSNVLGTTCQNNLREKPKEEPVEQATSYFWNDTPSKQQTSNQRVSRRKELILRNKNSLSARHRSVSYLEQFRKNNYGNNNLDSSRYSIAGSRFSDRDKSMSVTSCLSEESRISEFEFYEELMMSPRNEQLTWNKGSLQSSTLLSEKVVKSAKSNKSTVKNKAKPIILSRIEVTIPNQEKTNLDKKRSIEKRETYAKNVKLRNQMKINRQKERDKQDKFNGSSVLSNLSFEECPLQPQPTNVNQCLSVCDRRTSGLHPTTVAVKEKSLKIEQKIPKNEFVQKTKRRGMKQTQNKKSMNISELSKLQERHEKEKSLIESMKNLILKT